MKRFLRVLTDECGVTAVEYAVMLSLIVVVLLGSVALVGDKTYGLWTSIHSNLNDSGVFK